MVKLDASAVVARFARLHMVVWGDLVADEFVHGEISRVSREAPVLILKYRERAVVPGGAANAAANLATLGVRVSAVGVIGQDESGERLLDRFGELGVDVSGVSRVRRRPTPTKTRILAGHPHTTRQQVVRIDREPAGPPESSTLAALLANARRLGRRAHGILISDYGYGSVSPAALDELRRHLAADQVVSVDARYQLSAYRRMTAATPNESELEEAFHIRIGNDLRKLEEAGRRLLARLGTRWLLVTRGRDGMALFEDQKPTLHIPIFGTEEALDVTGAGDTVIAAFTAALSAGADGETAARVANCAAGLVVMKRGTATVKPDELTAAIEKAHL